MKEQEKYEKLSKQSPTGYKLNELIPFSYPVRKLKLNVLVNKQPDGSLVNIYNVILKAIKTGFQSQEKLFDFLGLGKTDEFILRELYLLREKDYINVHAEKWMLTEKGEQFLKDNTVLRIEEEEEYDFLLDGISGEVLSSKVNPVERNSLRKYLPFELKIAMKSPDLLENKFQALADVYKNDNAGNSYLISYLADEIKKDYENWSNYYLVEYVSASGSNQEPRLEVRSLETLKENKNLTSKFNSVYRHFFHVLSNPDKIKNLSKSAIEM